MHTNGSHVENILTDKVLEKPGSAPISFGTNNDNIVKESLELKIEETIPSDFPKRTRNPPEKSRLQVYVA